MNQEERLLAIVNRVSYRPGVRLLVSPATEIGVALWLEAKVPDSNEPTREIRTSNVVQFDLAALEAADDETILRSIFDFLVQWEIHEAKEFFRVDGVTAYSPHPEKAVA